MLQVIGSGGSSGNSSIFERSVLFVNSAIFKVPEGVDTIYITGSGGGATGGYSGSICIKEPIQVNAGEELEVTIGNTDQDTVLKRSEKALYTLNKGTSTSGNVCYSACYFANESGLIYYTKDYENSEFYDKDFKGELVWGIMGVNPDSTPTGGGAGGLITSKILQMCNAMGIPIPEASVGIRGTAYWNTYGGYGFGAGGGRGQIGGKGAPGVLLIEW